MTCWVKSSSAFASENEIGLEGARDLRGGRCPLQRCARTPPMDAWAFACDGLWKIPGRRSRFAKGGPSHRTAHHRLRAWLVLHPGGRPRGRVHWYLLIAAAVFALLLAYASGWFLTRSTGLDGTTALFASVPGGAAEMTILG